MADQTEINVQQLFNNDALGAPEPSTISGGEWMSVQEASNATGLSMGTLRRYVKARKLKSRRLGRSINSKLEVFITAGFLPDEADQSEVVEYDGEISSLTEQEEEAAYLENDHSDQPDRETLAWLRKKLDEKDALIAEKEAKLERLSHELASAAFRNGYLESEKAKFEERLLLIEDKQKAEEEAAKAPTPESVLEPAPPKSGWAKLASWFTGS